MRILIVKLSSMGDLIQALPAVSDCHQRFPDASIDWVVDESFAEIPRWHPAIQQVHTTAHRRWKKNLLAKQTRSEIKQLYRTLRANRYDYIIDAQTNLKSAVVTAISRGVKHGPNASSVREYGAHWAYKHHYPLPKNQLAIDRWRQLFAQVLGYSFNNSHSDTALDFGLKNTRFLAAPNTVPTEPFLLYVHNASWPSKLWPEKNWQVLLEYAAECNFKVLLPWGNSQEKQQAERIVSAHNHAEVLPKLSLGNIAALMQASAGAICMDTGLAHLAASLDIPTITLYGPTDAALIGATGAYNAQLNAQGFSCIPCYKKECYKNKSIHKNAQCLASLSAEDVWASFQQVESRHQAQPTQPQG